MKKTVLAILLTVALIGTVMAGCHSKPEEGESSTAATSATQQASTETTGTANTETTAAVTETAAQDNVPAFIKEGCWYFYEEEDKMAYAFMFGDGGSVTVAYFNRENVEGDDAKYFEGTAQYALDGKTLTVSEIPADVGMSHFELDVDGEDLLYNGIKLDRQEKLSLDYPFEHFNG